MGFSFFCFKGHCKLVMSENIVHIIIFAVPVYFTARSSDRRTHTEKFEVLLLL